MGKGDRVRLKRSALGAVQDPSKWKNRHGEVVTIRRVSDQVIVKWDDRTTWDAWPIRALEVVGGGDEVRAR
jgi:hypothetical protein